jgi:hypothetical protein
MGIKLGLSPLRIEQKLRVFEDTEENIWTQDGGSSRSTKEII